jgi:hypothetical protein
MLTCPRLKHWLSLYRAEVWRKNPLLDGLAGKHQKCSTPTSGGYAMWRQINFTSNPPRCFLKPRCRSEDIMQALPYATCYHTPLLFEHTMRSFAYILHQHRKQRTWITTSTMARVAKVMREIESMPLPLWDGWTVKRKAQREKKGSEDNCISHTRAENCPVTNRIMHTEKKRKREIEHNQAVSCDREEKLDPCQALASL